jgi:hypothetical protein
MEMSPCARLSDYSRGSGKTDPQRLRVQSNVQIFDRLIRFDDFGGINQAVAQSGEVIKPILWIVDT